MVAGDNSFGAPSDPITVGEVGGRPPVAFPAPARPGLHRFPPPHPLTGQLWRRRSIVSGGGFLAPTAVGSLTPFRPSPLAFPYSRVYADRTRARRRNDVGRATCRSPTLLPVVLIVAIATAREQVAGYPSLGHPGVIVGPRFFSNPRRVPVVRPPPPRAERWRPLPATPRRSLARELALSTPRWPWSTDWKLRPRRGRGRTRPNSSRSFGRPRQAPARTWVATTSPPSFNPRRPGGRRPLRPTP